MKSFDEQLQDLFQKIVIMGSTAESMIHLSMRALVERNDTLMGEVYAKDPRPEVVSLAWGASLLLVGMILTIRLGNNAYIRYRYRNGGAGH